MLEQMNITPEAEKEQVIDLSVTPLRTFDELKPEEKEKVLELKTALDDYSASALINFSSATSSTISRDTDNFLRNTKLNDLQDFNETMLELSNKLKSVDTKKLSEVKENPFSKWPVI